MLFLECAGRVREWVLLPAFSFSVPHPPMFRLFGFQLCGVVTALVLNIYMGVYHSVIPRWNDLAHTRDIHVRLNSVVLNKYWSRVLPPGVFLETNEQIDRLDAHEQRVSQALCCLCISVGYAARAAPDSVGGSKLW